jgi:2-polyprenyl-3-methyl-5-hydroxy-6-metoxy-1,4-benzoquinol methylase
MDKQQKKLILEAIGRIEGACQTLRSLAEEKSQTAVPEKAPIGETQPELAAKKASKAGEGSKYATASSLPAGELGPVPDFQDSNWPAAVQPHLIVSADADDAEKQFRALQVVGVLGLDFKDTTTLDFGCGEGHVTKEIATHAKKAVGFDIKQDDGWESKSGGNLILTADSEQVEKNAPYDYIILYDVLDHLEGQGPASVLKRLVPLMAPGAKMFCRCHPWTSRHGSHLYEKINKAYVHLVLTPDELAQAGFVADYNLRLARPMAAYENWFDLAGLKVEERKVTQDPVPEYFQGEILDRVIKVTWGGNIEPDQAMKIMSNQFVNYLVTTGKGD